MTGFPILDAIDDWDDAYANAVHIPGGDAYAGRWAAKAAAFRDALAASGRARLDRVHGDDARDRHDLFVPEGRPRGLVMFIHGGYWMRFDKSFWSHLANGPMALGFAVAIPSYPLCPQARIGAIAGHVGRAIESAAGEIDGPVALAGHSAGGQLASRMATSTSPLSSAVAGRVRRIVSISGVHDLRPLMRTAMNATLRLDIGEATAESPALLAPADGTTLIAWAGGGERAEFRRQNSLIASMWRGLGARAIAVEEPDRHHFDVIEGLERPDHALTRTLCADD